MYQFDDYTELAAYLLTYKDRVLTYDKVFKPLMDLIVLTNFLRELYAEREAAIIIGDELEVGILWGLVMTLFINRDK